MSDRLEKYAALVTCFDTISRLAQSGDMHAIEWLESLRDDAEKVCGRNLDGERLGVFIEIIRRYVQESRN